MTTPGNSGSSADAGLYAALDGWRGICAVLVALFHFRTSGYLDGLALVRNAYLCVDFFFVLSGFIVSHAYMHRLGSAAEVAVMVWRRLARLWPLHAAMLAAFVGLELATGGLAAVTGLARRAPPFDPASGALLGAIPSNLLLLHSLGLHSQLTWNMPSWSISAEFWTYAIFAAAIRLAPRRSALIAICIATLSGLVLLVATRKLALVHWDFGFFRCLYGFFIGHLVYLLHVRAREVALPGATALEAATIGALVAFIVLAGPTRLAYAAPLVCGLAVWVFARQGGRVSAWLACRPLALLGRWSYSIYMVHALVIALIHRALTVAGQLAGVGLSSEVQTATGRAWLVSFANPLAMDLLTIGYLAAVVAIAAWTWRRIEMPAQRALNGLALEHLPAKWRRRHARPIVT